MIDHLDNVCDVCIEDCYSCKKAFLKAVIEKHKNEITKLKIKLAKEK